MSSIQAAEFVDERPLSSTRIILENPKRYQNDILRPEWLNKKPAFPRNAGFILLGIKIPKI